MNLLVYMLRDFPNNKMKENKLKMIKNALSNKFVDS